MIQAIAWHPNTGEWLAIAWDLAAGRERCRVPLGPGLWEDIATSPDGSRVAVLGSPPELAGKLRIPQWVKIIDLNSGAVVCSSTSLPGSPQLGGVAFSHDSKHLVMTCGSSASSNDWVVVWYDASTLTPVARLPIGSRASVGGLSADGRLIAIREHRLAGYLGEGMGWDTVRVFPVLPILRAEAPAPLYEITGSASEFGSAEFSPDGRRLLAGEGRLRLWDSASGAEVLSLRDRGLSGFTMTRRSFSLDGRKIWGELDENSRLMVWDATPLDEAKTP
jgi:WD40 repeat protein